MRSTRRFAAVNFSVIRNVAKMVRGRRKANKGFMQEHPFGFKISGMMLL